jgi:hypothetical protein
VVCNLEMKITQFAQLHILPQIFVCVCVLNHNKPFEANTEVNEWTFIQLNYAMHVDYI